MTTNKGVRKRHTTTKARNNDRLGIDGEKKRRRKRNTKRVREKSAAKEEEEEEEKGKQAVR